jgi:hypothetical protein
MLDLVVRITARSPQRRSEGDWNHLMPKLTSEPDLDVPIMDHILTVNKKYLDTQFDHTHEVESSHSPLERENQ